MRPAYAVADPGDVEQVQAAADATIARFGGFDTGSVTRGGALWTLRRCPLEEQRKLFDTNFWGIVHGSLIVVKHLRVRMTMALPGFKCASAALVMRNIAPTWVE